MRIVSIDLNKDYSEVIGEALEVLKFGGVIVYPTDTVYGLGANALDELAALKIFRIKERDLSKPLPILIKNLIWAKELAFIDSKHEKFLNKVWPGKTTVIFPKKGIVPSVTTAGVASVGLRVPDYPFVDKLLGKFGYPLTGISANVSGNEATNDIERVVNDFKGKNRRPDLVIDVGLLPKTDPSTVVDLTGDQPKILRVGPSKPDQLMKLLEM